MLGLTIWLPPLFFIDPFRADVMLADLSPQLAPLFLFRSSAKPPLPKEEVFLLCTASLLFSIRRSPFTDRPFRAHFYELSD